MIYLYSAHWSSTVLSTAVEDVFMNRKSMIVVSALAALFLGKSVIAHHSFDAEFDRQKPVKLVGSVTKVEWGNPHIWIFIDVKEDGKVSNWGVEGGAPNALFRNGWRKDSVKVGDILTVEGNRAKDGSLRANANRVTLPDGRRVFAGSSGGDR
jgi:hypothetical protein